MPGPVPQSSMPVAGTAEPGPVVPGALGVQPAARTTEGVNAVTVSAPTPDSRVVATREEDVSREIRVRNVVRLLRDMLLKPLSVFWAHCVRTHRS